MKKIEKAWQQAKASAEIEGFRFTPEDEKIIKDAITGKRTREDLINKYKQKSHRSL